MNVLHFYKTYFPDTIGGVEQVINQLAISTAQCGVTPTVLSMTPERNAPSPLQIDGHNVYRCRSQCEVASTPFAWSALKRFRDLVQQADVVHYHFPYPVADLLHFAYARHKPSVVSYHSDIIKQKHLLKLYNPLQMRFLGNVGRIVAASPNYLASSSVLSQFSDKTMVIPYGLDQHSYDAPTPHKLNHWRERLGDKFFLFVGVIRYYKGLHVLVEAAKSTSYPIVILGGGPLEQALKQQAKEQGVTNIHFLGFLDNADKMTLFSLCYAFVFPSHLRSEAFGISLLEGAMFGKPLISCEIGTGTSYINIDNETGLVIPPDNANALRQAMDTLWNNADLATRMGQKAAQRFAQLFTADKMADSYTALYRELIAEAAVKLNK